tara:strand:- start:521 stop:838 length:318 start_codon:yes stop_codon:yes gene_type:complete
MKISISYSLHPDVVPDCVKSALRYINQTWGDVEKVSDGTWRITERDEYGGDSWILSEAMFEKGVRMLATEKPQRFAGLVDEVNFDAITGDLIVQYALWGEDRYVA